MTCRCRVDLDVLLEIEPLVVWIAGATIVVNVPRPGARVLGIERRCCATNEARNLRQHTRPQCRLHGRIVDLADQRRDVLLCASHGSTCNLLSPAFSPRAAGRDGGSAALVRRQPSSRAFWALPPWLSAPIATVRGIRQI